MSTTRRSVTKAGSVNNLGANPASFSEQTQKGRQQLPSDMLSDLRDSFKFFAHGDIYISRNDFESVIHNFGFNRVSQREKE